MPQQSIVKPRQETANAVTAKPSPVGTELYADVSTTADPISNARLDSSKQLFSLNSNILLMGQQVSKRRRSPVWLKQRLMNH